LHGCVDNFVSRTGISGCQTDPVSERGQMGDTARTVPGDNRLIA
jgi:hypothetical protein